jgi:hypothetical protein
MDRYCLVHDAGWEVFPQTWVCLDAGSARFAGGLGGVRPAMAMQELDRSCGLEDGATACARWEIVGELRHGVPW